MQRKYHTTLRATLPTLLLLWGTVFITTNTRTVFGPLSEDISAAFGIPTYEVILLSSFIAVGNIISLLFSGHIAYILMHTRTLILSLTLLISGLLCAAFAANIGFFKMGLVLIGVGSGLYPGSGIPIANAMSSESIRSNVIAIHETGPIGAFIFVPLFSALVLLFTSWRAVLISFAVMCAFLLVAIVLGCKEGYFRGKPLTVRNMGVLVRRPSYVLLVLAFAVVGAVNTVVYTSMVDFFVVFKQFDSRIVTLVQSLSRVSGVLMVFFASIIMLRMPAVYVGVFTGCAAGTLTLLMGIIPGGEVFIVVFLQTFIMSGFFPSVLVLAGKCFPGSLQSLVIMSMILGSQVANIVFNQFYKWFASQGNLDGAFVMMGFAAVTVSLLLWLTALTKPLAEEVPSVDAAHPPAAQNAPQDKTPTIKKSAKKEKASA